jgi:hypothetical protein
VTTPSDRLLAIDLGASATTSESPRMPRSQHLTTPTDFGFRIVEIWDEKAGFDRFVEQRLVPAAKAVRQNRETQITVTPLHNLFAPRLDELPGLIPSLPGAPGTRAT